MKAADKMPIGASHTAGYKREHNIRLTKIADQEISNTAQAPLPVPERNEDELRQYKSSWQTQDRDASCLQLEAIQKYQ